MQLKSFFLTLLVLGSTCFLRGDSKDLSQEILFELSIPQIIEFSLDQGPWLKLNDQGITTLEASISSNTSWQLTGSTESHEVNLSVEKDGHWKDFSKNGLVFLTGETPVRKRKTAIEILDSNKELTTLVLTIGSPLSQEAIKAMQQRSNLKKEHSL